MIPAILLMASLATASIPARALFAADAPDSASCTLYGRHWAVALSAPAGWVIECRGPQSTNVTVALWPVGSSWRDAPVVMSVTSVSRTAESLPAFANSETYRFRKEHPGAAIGVGSDLRTLEGRFAVVRYITGDEFGNRSAVAYLDTGPARLIIMLSSSQEREFTKHLEDFATLVAGTAVAKATAASD